MCEIYVKILGLVLDVSSKSYIYLGKKLSAFSELSCEGIEFQIVFTSGAKCSEFARRARQPRGFLAYACELWAQCYNLRPGEVFLIISFQLISQLAIHYLLYYICTCCNIAFTLAFIIQYFATNKQKMPFKVIKQADGSKDVYLNSKYRIKKGEDYYEVIEILVQLINEKNRHHVFQHPSITFYSSLEFVLGKLDMKNQQCVICMDCFAVKDLEKEIYEPNDEDVYQLACSHKFHCSCLKEYIGVKKSFKCPICSEIFGELEGDMPPGKIDIFLDKKLKCDGYEPGTIIIKYKIPSGFRNGKPYTGTSRTAYVPKTPEGEQVVQLLEQAWHQKLTFTVGTSVTTGLDNQVVWNGIHHKTSPNGGAFGYPDKTYFKRVKEQLAAKGIVAKQKIKN